MNSSIVYVFYAKSFWEELKRLETIAWEGSAGCENFQN